DSGETSSDNEWNQKLIGVNTEFSIKHLLKGEEGKSRLKVLHYRLDKGVSILKGPSLLAFRSKSSAVKSEDSKIEIPKPEYLLFLRARKDGRYEPVAGQIDATTSVRELLSPLPIP